MKDDGGRSQPPAELEERREERGRRHGDRFIRIVRPYREDFRKTASGQYVATERVLLPGTRVGRGLEALRRIVIGRRLASEEEITERVSKKIGLAIFASDNISSSAYATEETMRILVLAGAAALALTLPVTLGVITVLAIVVLSYLQAIRAYPNGGGSYVVAKENLGAIPGLVAAAALLTDYVLTVAVSIAAGVAALGAALPFIYEQRVLVGVSAIALLTVGNLRGLRESGNIFAAPTYLYLVTVGGILAYGLFRSVTGDLPLVETPPEWVEGWRTEHPAQPLSILLVLRAFASGAVALTGTEAVANGVTAFKPPEARNASTVLLLMGTSFGALFFATNVLASGMGIVPDPTEEETVLSLITGALVGEGWLFYLAQIATALLLVLAANTAFNGFPRLGWIMANDGFLPRQFAYRGDRLAFSTGIVVLATVSALLLVAYGGSVTNLIPLYTVGVFIAFTLSQAGLVRRWLRVRGRGWRPSLVMNALGAVATGIVAVIVGVTKFEHGAWMVIAVIPALVALLYGVFQHYRRVEDALVVGSPEEARIPTVSPLVLVPIGRLDRAAIHALTFARQISGDVRAVHVTDDAERGEHMKRRWSQLVPDIPLVIIQSPYRALVAPLLRYLAYLDRHDPQRPIVVVLSEFVPRHWWEAVLHNQTALRLKLRLFFRPNTVVVDVPYRVSERSPGGR